MVWAFQSGLGGWQIVNMVVGGVVLAALLGMWKLVNGKADKITVAEHFTTHETDDVKEHAHIKDDVAKLEVKLDAALLIVGATITRPEMVEKIADMRGRSDDKMARVMADIVTLFAESKANAKQNAETDKKLDDLPARMRTLEEKDMRKS